MRDTKEIETLTLRQMRLRRMLSVTELAKRAGVGTSTISAIEQGICRTPHLATIRKLAAALDCAPQAIAWPGNPFAALGGVQIEVAEEAPSPAHKKTAETLPSRR